MSFLTRERVSDPRQEPAPSRPSSCCDVSRLSREPRSPARSGRLLTIERLGALLVGLAGAGCGGEDPDDAGGSAPLFTEITAEAGFGGDPAPWAPGTYWIPEISPGGVALLDFDGDGDLDIYRLIQPPSDSSRPGAPKPLATAAPNRLWAQGDDGRFVEVPGAAGLDDPAIKPEPERSACTSGKRRARPGRADSHFPVQTLA